jgi:uncharacterized repeat protein (TIGR04138 family)
VNREQREQVEAIRRIVNDDPRYAVNAYLFVKEAISFTDSQLNRSSAQHISGQELLTGARQYALDQFGPMAHSVLSEWGITCTRDIGCIVFLMVAHGLLGASEEDSIEDFVDIFDFREAFVNTFLPAGKDVQIPVIA